MVLVFTISCMAQGIDSRNEAKIDLVQSQYGLSGEGVLTIMMDRGIDYRHPDFIDENGETRIAFIFDLLDDTGANDTDNPYGMGTIYDAQEINAELMNGTANINTDLFGHGTATTGIFCGNGSGITDAERFRGVAYNSTIISIIVTKDFVPPFDDDPGQIGEFDPARLQAGFDFASDKIEELAMPSVTLLNIGSISDPTDGSIALCDVFENYTSKNHSFVCGVGDDGGKENHMIAELTEGQETTFEINKGEAGNLRFIAWYNEQDRVSLTIQRPNGVVEGPFSPPSGPSGVEDVFLDQINIFHRAKDVEFAQSDSELRQLLIDFYGDQGNYIVRLSTTDLSSDGTLNAFLNPARYNNSNSFLNNDNPGGNINSYAACPSVISPSDYVATNNWVDIDGISRMRTNEGLPGELWVGSSTGPTMDGRIGVDFAAPGEIAASAYGEDSFYSSFSFNVLEDSDRHYGIQTAVSAAAPITAGVIALLLEVNPALTPEEIKSILQASARSDSFTGTTPNEIWGYGKLDALAAVNLALATVSTDDTFIVDEEQWKLSPNPSSSIVQIKHPSSSQAIQSVSLYTLEGVEIKTTYNTKTNQLDIKLLPAGTYIVRIQLKEQNIIRKLLKQ